MEDSLKIIALAKKLGGSGGGSGGGTTDYEELDNLPSVNGVELRGNNTAEQLGLMSEESAEDLENAKQVTYAELKALRDNSQLVPGMLYRITDYVTTINGTIDLREVGAYDSYITDESRPPKWFHYARSAGHQFDLVVIAVGENELDGSARACHHEGDTYFANSDLGAWQLKYTIDNDATYSFADPNGKGVITWMRDEFNNECFYDFKNVQYLCYALEMEDSSTAKDALCYDPTNNKAMRYGNSANVFFAIDDWMYNAGEEDFVSPIVNHKLVAQDVITTCINYPTVDATYLETFNADWYYTFTGLTLDRIDDISLNNFNKRTEYGELCRDNFIALQISDLVDWWDGYTDRRDVIGLPASVFFSFMPHLDGDYRFNQLRTNELTNEILGVIIGDGAYNNVFERLTESVIYSRNSVCDNRISSAGKLVVNDVLEQNTIDSLYDVTANELRHNYFPRSYIRNSFCSALINSTALADANISKANFKCDVYDCLFKDSMSNVEVVGLNGNYKHYMYCCAFDSCSNIVFTINNSRLWYMRYETVGTLRGTSADDKLNISLSSNGNKSRDYTICIGMDSNGQLKEWIPAEGLSASDVPSKTSDLTNDSGFLTLATLPIWDGGVSG